MQKRQESIEQIEARALKLLEEHALESNNASRHRIEEFKALSNAHSAALQRAHRFIQLSQQLAERPKADNPSMSLRLNIAWARVAESNSAVTALCVMFLILPAMWWAGLNPWQSAGERNIAASIEQPVVDRYSTKWHQQREVELADGTSVWLGWRTRLEAEFSSNSRNVTLINGTAAFKVTKDQARPFFVIANGVQTKVVGTEFVVDLQSNERVEIAVLEGEVDVKGPDLRSVALKPEQVVSVSDGVTGTIAHRSLHEIGQWRDGMLVFEERPVLDALAELGSYTRHKLDLRALQGHSGLVSGVFFIDQADEALVTILEAHRLDSKLSDANTLTLF
ncbi:MAG: FecR domain-containing protein [Pseudomonadota bacterium]